jgi:hydroxypyruvate reductase
MAASLRRQALQIFRAALKAANPYQAVLRHLRLSPQAYQNIFVIGGGKASAQMARAVERLIGARITAGEINVKDGHGAKLRRIKINECGHPVPDQRGVAGARRIAQIASQAGPDDLVICLISGGASALLPLPAPSITLVQKQKITRSLLACGASIHEINCVRKHISAIKGGQLARLAYPATLLTLILSDVVGDDLDVIGSGPTVPDRSAIADARAVLNKYGIPNKLQMEETPKPGDKVFQKTRNVIVGSNALAVDAAAIEAVRLGFNTLVLSTSLVGEAREVARVHAAIAREIQVAGRPVRVPACVISGGETTVTIRGKGLGGRNQEFALAAAIDIAGLGDTVILSAGTDGTDGPTDAAGAIADGETLARAQALGLDASAYLMNNDSYHFFKATGDLIQTGPTGTNVADIQLILVR